MCGGWAGAQKMHTRRDLGYTCAVIMVAVLALLLLRLAVGTSTPPHGAGGLTKHGRTDERQRPSRELAESSHSLRGGRGTHHVDFPVRAGGLADDFGPPADSRCNVAVHIR